jgi:sugar (pentulose or hexulose) kinase
MADVLQRPIHQLDHAQHVTALGAALTAFARLNLIKPADFPSFVRERRVVEPNGMLEKLYDERFDQFTAAFKALRPLSHKMNGGQASL